MELTGAAEAARKVRDEKSERWWRLVTRRGSVGVERWVRAQRDKFIDVAYLLNMMLNIAIIVAKMAIAFAQ